MIALEELVNSLYETIQDAKNVPLSNEKCMIEREPVLDILDEIRASIPTDLKMAKEIVEKRADVIASGKKEADELRSKAEEYARKLVNESEIVTASEKRAQEIVAAAEAQSQQICDAVLNYCAERLETAEQCASQSLQEIQECRQRFLNTSQTGR